MSRGLSGCGTRDTPSSNTAFRGALLLALTPALAAANAGIGFFTLTWPAVLLGLIPTAGLEGFVFARLLRLSWRRALALALAANAISTGYGLALSFWLDALLLGSTGSSGLEPTKDRVSMLLAPLFGLSWWIEQRVIRRRAPALPRTAVVGAVGVANFLSYGVIMAGVQWTAFFPHIAPSFTTRLELREGFDALQALKPRVEAFWSRRHHFPTDLGALERADHAGSGAPTPNFTLALVPNGQLIVRFHHPQKPLLDGKHLKLTPVLPQGC